TLANVIAPNMEIAVVQRVIRCIPTAIIIPTTYALDAEEVDPQRQAGPMGQVMHGITHGIAAGPAQAGHLSHYYASA
ncbi:MFS transporter, partial [Pseudomonas aeruginosa]